MKHVKSISFIAVCSFFSLAYAKNAGVLPFAVYKDDIFILLGKESGGPNKGTWADFGGKGKKNESPRNVAIREFSEETRGAFSNFRTGEIKNYGTAFKKSQKYISEQMKEGVNNPGPRVYYTLYPAFVRYIPPKNIEDGLYQDHEKSEFRWVNARELIDTIKDQKRENAKYRDMQIRPQLASYFINAATRNKIEELLQLDRTTSQAEEQQPEEAEEREFWVESYAITGPYYPQPGYQEEEELWRESYELPPTQKTTPLPSVQQPTKPSQTPLEKLLAAYKEEEQPTLPPPARRAHTQQSSRIISKDIETILTNLVAKLRTLLNKLH